jgi:hypothetical protein
VHVASDGPYRRVVCKAGSRLSDVQPIPLRDTVNRIEHFAPDGSPANVVKARGNFGSDIYMVLSDDDPLTTIRTANPKTHAPIHLTRPHEQ